MGGRIRIKHRSQLAMCHTQSSISSSSIVLFNFRTAAISRMECTDGSTSGSDSCFFDDGSFSASSSVCDCYVCTASLPENYAYQQLLQVNRASHLTAPRHRLIKWSLPPPPIVGAALPGWRPMPFGLETFWQSSFAWFFGPFYANYGHVWTLEPTDVPPMSFDWPWHLVTYSAKVRFLCPKNHGWTSMKGRVNFWYRMRRQGSEIICEALFRLFGQECSRCRQSYEMEFVNPLWYPEEIENSFRFLCAKVCRVYYGGSSKDLCLIRRIRRSEPGFGSTHHHDPVRCQACLENQCILPTKNRFPTADFGVNCSVRGLEERFHTFVI